VVVCFLLLILFIVGTFVVLGPVLSLPLPLTSCQDNRSSLLLLSVLSSVSEKSAVGVSSLLVLLGMCGLYNRVVVVEWILAAYMLLGVVSAVRMKLGTVSSAYVRLVTECLVHIGSLCLGTLLFADENLDNGLALMIDLPPGHASLLTSLQVLASLGRNQCCLPCLCWSE
jgi:hypothetical protein